MDPVCQTFIKFIIIIKIIKTLTGRPHGDVTNDVSNGGSCTAAVQSGVARLDSSIERHHEVQGTAGSHKGAAPLAGGRRSDHGERWCGGDGRCMARGCYGEVGGRRGAPERSGAHQERDETDGEAREGLNQPQRRRRPAAGVGEGGLDSGGLGLPGLHKLEGQ